MIEPQDNLLHFYLYQDTFPLYDYPVHPVLNRSSNDLNDPNNPYALFALGSAPKEQCQDFLNGRGQVDADPCSISISPHYNLADASTTYKVLSAGVGQTTATQLGTLNVNQTIDAQYAGQLSPNEVLTVYDSRTNLNHFMLFWLDGALNYGPGGQFDYVAPTHSMSTMCQPTDPACDIAEGSSLYNCSFIF